MNCSEARTALTLGTLAQDPRLERHLGGCPSCARLAAVERRIDEARRWLAGEPPFGIDVRDRVLREIVRLRPPERDEVQAWQLGLAAAAAVLVVAALAALAWVGQPDWGASARALDGLLRAGAEVASAIGAAVLAALRVSIRLLAALSGAASPFAELAARLEPLALVGVGLCYAIMAGTILHVLGRDLRRVAHPDREER